MSALDPIFISNRIVDMVFLVDLVIHFFLMYSESAGPLAGEHWIDDRRKIALHYLRGWFALDLLALVAGAFDIITLILLTGAPSSVSTIRAMRVALRLLRVARLLKMIRLVNFRRVLKRWEDVTGETVTVSHATSKLVQCIILVITVSHWFACVWGLQAAFNTTRFASWMGEFGYCTELAADAGGGNGASSVPSTTNCAEPFALYVAAFYWSVMTITSIVKLHPTLTQISTPLS